jgi:hypothetical protein
MRNVAKPRLSRIGSSFHFWNFFKKVAAVYQTVKVGMSFEKAAFINSSYINIDFQAFDIAGLGVTALKHAHASYQDPVDRSLSHQREALLQVK